MSAGTKRSDRSTDRLVRAMAVVAIVVTVAGILLPRFPESLSLVVCPILLVMVVALGGEELQARRTAARPVCLDEPAERAVDDEAAKPASDLHYPGRGATMAPLRASSSDG